MRQAGTRIRIETRGKGLVDVTKRVEAWLAEQRIATGLLTAFLRHTSASLVIQENADPTVLADLEAFFAKLAPEGRGLYRHDDEGPDDMPAHLKAALTRTSLGVPVSGGRLVLGTWQAIYLFEHRARPHLRELHLHVLGE
ncbi:MAG: secondary thiamine-phosphate synthase enzyme YjbQ [Proteobacteria bacterium]|jgi:secondary thiamine-phosphate synthase enzyme|nr:secondary thiamine-phosphate synthase enzyme YjbQ [Pseudomonadota bacterium]